MLPPLSMANARPAELEVAAQKGPAAPAEMGISPPMASQICNSRRSRIFLSQASHVAQSGSEKLELTQVFLQRSTWKRGR